MNNSFNTKSLCDSDGTTYTTRPPRAFVARLFLLLICAGALVVPASAVNNPPYWIQKSPQTSPSGRNGRAMAYDAAHGQVVLFGGVDNNGSFLSDTWVWDGINWTQKTPANSPPARFVFAMAYDAAHGQVVLFGGTLDLNNSFSDTWVWDGTNWTQKTPVNSPPARFAHAMAYDAAHGQVVLFGGTPDYHNGLSDTWVWDGTNWTQKQQSSPSGRYGHSMAYDASHAQVVLFGGVDANGTSLSDTWVWDGTNWIQKQPQASPSVRTFHAMAYDAAHGQVVLFGGRVTRLNNGNLLSDTWVWDGTNWTQKQPQASPPGRGDSAMAYDAAHGQVVLFGGNSGANLSDTWVWAHGIFATAGNSQSTPAGSPFSLPLEVTVIDNTGANVSGAQVTFSGPASMVSLSSMTAPLTGADGRAHITATATATVGSYLVTASLSGGDFATFMLTNTASPVATTLNKTAGDNQSAKTGQSYATNLKVTVLDQNSMPVQGAMVTFTVVPGGTGASGTFGSTPTQPIAAGADGTATAPVLTANATAGVFTVTAKVNALTVTFNLTNIVNPPSNGDVTLNFDATPLAPGVVTDATAYLNSFGITLSAVTPGASVLIIGQVSPNCRQLNCGYPIPTSAPNYFNQSNGNHPETMTLNFPHALSKITFFRTGMTFDSKPQWTAEALNAQGAVVASVGEPLTATEAQIPAQQFTLSGTGITALRINSDNQDYTALSGVPIDDLMLTTADADAHPPVFVSPPTPMSGISIYAGNPLSFSVQASDADPGDSVTLSVDSLPAGAVYIGTSLPATNNPVGTTVAWTPTSAQGGTYAMKFTAKDKAGQAATTIVSVEVKVDTTPPVIVPTVTGTAGTNGWYTSNVNVSWSVTDPESGIGSSTGCGPVALTANSGGTTVTCSATNGAGLSASQSVTVKIDHTAPIIAPTVTGTLGTNGWYTSPVSVAWSVTDPDSGIASPVCTATNLSSNTPGMAVSCSAMNGAGLISSQSLTVKIDQTAPVITPTVTGALGANGWYTSNVTVSWNVTDLESGLFASTGCSPTTLTNETAGITVTCSAMNGAGLTNSVPVKVKLDKTPPVISGMPAAGCKVSTNGGHSDEDEDPERSAVRLVKIATVTAADVLSGLAPGSLKVTGTSNQPSKNSKQPQIVITPNGSGGFVVQVLPDSSGDSSRVYTLTATASDLAGNTATVKGACTVPNRQD